VTIIVPFVSADEVAVHADELRLDQIINNSPVPVQYFVFRHLHWARWVLLHKLDEDCEVAVILQDQPLEVVGHLIIIIDAALAVVFDHSKPIRINRSTRLSNDRRVSLHRVNHAWQTLVHLWHVVSAHLLHVTWVRLLSRNQVWLESTLHHLLRLVHHWLCFHVGARVDIASII